MTAIQAVSCRSLTKQPSTPLWSKLEGTAHRFRVDRKLFSIHEHSSNLDGPVSRLGIESRGRLCIITALHGMQTRSSDKNSVCPSVRPSTKRVICDKMEERLVLIFISYERSFSLSVLPIPQDWTFLSRILCRSAAVIISVIRHARTQISLLHYITLRRMVGGAIPSTWNFGSTGSRWSVIADFQPIFARSSSAVTPSEKSSITTNRKSTTRFPMSLRWLS